MREDKKALTPAQEKKKALFYEKKNGWIDFNAGTIAEGKETVDEAGARLLEYVISVASGELTKAEVNGFREISILKDGVVL